MTFEDSKTVTRDRIKHIIKTLTYKTLSHDSTCKDIQKGIHNMETNKFLKDYNPITLEVDYNITDNEET